MRIEWAIPCRYCEVIGNEIFVTGGNAGVITVNELPAVVATWIALQVVAPDVEAGENVAHHFSAQILDPELQPVPDTAIEIPDFRMEKHVFEGWEAEQAVATQHFFEATVEGTYTIELAVDGRPKNVPIHVRQADERDDDE